MLVSIVGKSNSGKSSITELLCDYSDRIIKINIDKIGHYVLTFEDVKKELINSFGTDIVNNNSINRKKLGELVFNNQERMQMLTNITWKHMEKIIDKQLEDNKNKIIILDWLLLPKTKYFKMSDIKILVDAPFEVRMNRALIRDHITEEEFRTRERASMEFCEENFDYIIENLEVNKTKRKVRDIYGKSIISR